MNRALRNEDGVVYDIVCGTFFICGLGEEDFASLTDELAEKMMQIFKFPEYFELDANGKIKILTKM